MDIYQYCFQNSSEFFCVINSGFYFEIVNPNFEKHLGYSEKELLESNILSFVHPDDKGATEKDIEKLKSNKPVCDLVNRYCKKDGTYLWLKWNITPDQATGKFQAIAHDITKRKLAEAALDEQINTIIDLAPDAVVVFDADCIVTRWNAKAQAVFGWRSDEIVGKHFYKFITPQRHVEAHKNAIGNFLKIGEGPFLNQSFEIDAVNKQGAEFMVSYTISTTKENGKQIFIGFARDVTEKIKTQEELDKKTKELSRSNIELEQFAYIASHDLQEPLRTVTSYLELLEKRYKDKLDADANDFINFAVDGSTRMRILIQSLLEYSRVNRVKPFGWIDTNELLADVIQTLDSSVKESKATINMDNLPKIYGDQVLINQLFQNLIENAIKFRGAKSPEIIISGIEKNNEYLFSVKDNGIGIKKEHFGRLFVVFQRLHTKEEYPGVGIGLAICKKIVEKHGGKIWIESEMNEGSTFYFTIRKQNLN